MDIAQILNAARLTGKVGLTKSRYLKVIELHTTADAL